MKEMLSEEDLVNCDVIVIDSDNCSAQYKSGLHFYHLQEISNSYDKAVVRMYGIPGHGKGEIKMLMMLLLMMMKMKVSIRMMIILMAGTSLLLILL